MNNNFDRRGPKKIPIAFLRPLDDAQKAVEEWARNKELEQRSQRRLYEWFQRFQKRLEFEKRLPVCTQEDINVLFWSHDDDSLFGIFPTLVVRQYVPFKGSICSLDNSNFLNSIETSFLSTSLKLLTLLFALGFQAMSRMGRTFDASASPLVVQPQAYGYSVTLSGINVTHPSERPMLAPPTVMSIQGRTIYAQAASRCAAVKPLPHFRAHRTTPSYHYFIPGIHSSELTSPCTHHSRDVIAFADLHSDDQDSVIEYLQGMINEDYSFGFSQVSGQDNLNRNFHPIGNYVQAFLQTNPDPHNPLVKETVDRCRTYEKFLNEKMESHGQWVQAFSTFLTQPSPQSLQERNQKFRQLVACDDRLCKHEPEVISHIRQVMRGVRALQITTLEDPYWDEKLGTLSELSFDQNMVTTIRNLDDGSYRFTPNQKEPYVMRIGLMLSQQPGEFEQSRADRIATQTLESLTVQDLNALLLAMNHLAQFPDIARPMSRQSRIDFFFRNQAVWLAVQNYRGVMTNGQTIAFTEAAAQVMTSSMACQIAHGFTPLNPVCRLGETDLEFCDRVGILVPDQYMPGVVNRSELHHKISKADGGRNNFENAYVANSWSHAIIHGLEQLYAQAHGDTHGRQLHIDAFFSACMRAFGF